MVYERFPMLCDLDGCHMWLGDRKNQLPTTLTAEDEPRRNLQAKDIVVAIGAQVDASAGLRAGQDEISTLL